MSNQKASKYVNYTPGQLAYALSNEAMPQSKNREEIKGALSAVLITRLSDAIDRHQRAASRLALQVLILNVVLGLFTVVGTVLAIIQFVG